MTNRRPVMPLFYYYGIYPSHKNWIKARMRLIPEEFQQEVATQYSNLFLKNKGKVGRDAANNYLKGKVEEYRK